MKQEKDFSEAAANIVEIAKKVGVENIENEIRQTLESFYQDGVNDGIKVTWPWELVNEVEGTSTEFATDYENPFDIAPADLTSEYLMEVLFPAIERTIFSTAKTTDLSEYETYADFKKAHPEIEPALKELPCLLYVHNRYADVDMGLTEFDFDGWLNSCWGGLKEGKTIKDIVSECD